MAVSRFHHCECPECAERGDLLATAVRERENYNGDHQLARLEIERLKSILRRCVHGTDTVDIGGETICLFLSPSRE